MGNIFKQYLQAIAHVVGWRLLRWAGDASCSPSPSLSFSPSLSESPSPSPSPSEEITQDYQYRCMRCRKDFVIQHEVDKEGALCTPCFNGLIQVRSYKGYNKYLNK